MLLVILIFEDRTIGIFQTVYKLLKDFNQFKKKYVFTMAVGGGNSLIEAHPEILKDCPPWVIDLLGWMLVTGFSSLFYVIPGMLLFTAILLFYRPILAMPLILIFGFLAIRKTYMNDRHREKWVS